MLNMILHDREKCCNNSRLHLNKTLQLNLVHQLMLMYLAFSFFFLQVLRTHTSLIFIIIIFSEWFSNVLISRYLCCREVNKGGVCRGPVSPLPQPALTMPEEAGLNLVALHSECHNDITRSILLYHKVLHRLAPTHRKRAGTSKKAVVQVHSMAGKLIEGILTLLPVCVNTKFDILS